MWSQKNNKQFQRMQNNPGCSAQHEGSMVSPTRISVIANWNRAKLGRMVAVWQSR
jgi:hypothetical protein